MCRKLGYLPWYLIIRIKLAIIKTAKMNDTYNFGNSHCYVCITRPAPWRAWVTGKKSFNAFSVCVKHWNKKRKKEQSLNVLIKQHSPISPKRLQRYVIFAWVALKVWLVAKIWSSEKTTAKAQNTTFVIRYFSVALICCTCCSFGTAGNYLLIIKFIRYL